MDTVEIFDTTLRDGEQSPGAAMTAATRLKIARMLDEAGVDTIEAGFPISNERCVRERQSRSRNERRQRARCGAGALHGEPISRRRPVPLQARAGRASTSLSQPRRCICGISSESAPQRAVEMAIGRRCDARVPIATTWSSRPKTRRGPTRSFLAQIFSAAIAAGATTLNVPDTVGYTTPAEMERADRVILREHIAGVERARMSVHTHDDLGMATANALAAVRAGARQVECTINGIGERAGNCALEEIVVALRTRAELFGCSTRL